MKSLAFAFLGLLLASTIAAQMHQLPIVTDGNERTFQLPTGVTADQLQPGIVMVRVNGDYRLSCNDNSISVPSIQRILQDIGSTGVKKAFPNSGPPEAERDSRGRKLADISLIYKVSIPAGQNIVDACNQLLAAQEVAYAEPAYIYETMFTPNDPYFPGQIYLDRIKAAAAWNVTKGNKNIAIGIIDTGTSYGHPDLANKVKFNINDPIDGIDNDGDNYVDNYKGWDFSGNGWGEDNDATFVGNGPGRDHGVVVTGPAAAEVDNNYGVAGIGFNTTFIPLKAAPDNSLAIWNGYDAIVYAANHNIQICNLSWGAPGYSFVGHDVCKYATINKGILLVAAAGNTPKYIKFYPASYEEVLAVAGTFGTSDAAWITTPSFGTSWHHWIDICAPSRFITSTAKHNVIWWGATGTSLAAPQVCGAAALVKAEFPNLSMEQVGQRVRVTADDIYGMNPTKRDMLGVGRLNCYNALTKVTPAIRIDSLTYTDGKNNVNEVYDTVTVKVDLINYLDPNENLWVTLYSTDPTTLEVIKDKVHLPTIGTMQKSNFFGEFKVVIKSALTFKNVLMKLAFEDKKMDYKDFQYFYLPVHPTRIDVAVNHLRTTIDDAGSFGWFNSSKNNTLFGLEYDEQGNTLAHGGFLLGTSGSQFSNTVYNEYMQVERDFTVASPYDIKVGTNGDYRASVNFRNNNSATSGMNVNVTQNVYAWSDSLNDDFLIFEYVIRNDGAQALQKMNAGIFTWLFYNALNSGNSSYDPSRRMIICNSNNIGAPGNYIALSLLSEGKAHGSTWDYNAFFPFTDDKKYAAMTSLADSSNMSNTNKNLLSFLSGKPFTLAPGKEHRIAFALIGGHDLATVESAQEAAKVKYNCELNDRFTELDLGDDFVLCDGDSATLDASEGFVNWQWTDGSTGSTDVIKKAGGIMVHAQNEYGCTTTDTIVIKPGYHPASGLPASVDGCDEISLDASPSLATSYLWSTGEVSNEIDIKTSGTYTVQMVDSNGCHGVDEIRVKIRKVHAIVQADKLNVIAGESVNLTDVTPGSTWRNWQTGDGFTYNNNKEISHNYNMAGNYQVRLVAGDRFCNDTTTITINVTNSSLGTSNSDSKNLSVIAAYPNPNNGKFNLEFTINKPTNAFINLCDAGGRTVHQESFTQLGTGTHTVAVDPPTALSPGVYFLTLRGEDLEYHEKMVIRN